MSKTTESTNDMGKSVRQPAILVAILAIGYTCIGTFRFALGMLHSILFCAYLIVPFLAIRPLLRLRQLPRTLGLILLAPLLLVSSFDLLGRLFFDGLVGSREIVQPLQTFQQGSCTVELGRYSYGGAVGVRGVYLEQRRHIVPGLYVVRSIDFFDYAKGATLSVEEPYRVRVHATGNYYSNDFQVDKVYTLKPWVYF